MISGALTEGITSLKTELGLVATAGVGVLMVTWGALRAKGFFKGISK